MTKDNGKNPVGRPKRQFEPETAQELCSWIAEGNSMRSFLRNKRPDLCFHNIYKWLQENHDFAEQYARSRLEQADSHVDQILELTSKLYDHNGQMSHVQAVKVDIETRKWIASKLKPRAYGEKQLQEISGPNGGAIPITHSVAAPRALSRSEWIQVYGQQPQQIEYVASNSDTLPEDSITAPHTDPPIETLTVDQTNTSKEEK